MTKLPHRTVYLPKRRQPSVRPTVVPSRTQRTVLCGRAFLFTHGGASSAPKRHFTALGKLLGRVFELQPVTNANPPAGGTITADTAAQGERRVEDPWQP
jgi:hypothetical protein